MATKTVRVRVSQLIDMVLPEGVAVANLITPEIITLNAIKDGRIVETQIMQNWVLGSDRIEEVEKDAKW